jgi:DNA-nicking Smr family endonuclease
VLAQTRIKKMIEVASAEIIEKQIALARRGHPIVARFLLERLIPIAKSSPIEGHVDLTGTPAEQAQAILAALAAREMTQDDAHSLLQAIHTAQEISDAEELRKRLADIEAKLDALTAGTPAKPAAGAGENAS